MRRFAHTAASILIVALTLLAALAPASASAAGRSDADLAGRIAAALRASRIGGATSVVAWNADTHAVFYDWRGDVPVAPASNQKLYTTLAALRVLGTDSHLSTRLLLRGSQVADRLEGDAWLVGGGDPTLATPEFGRRNLGHAANLRSLGLPLLTRGITEVTGDVHVDDSLFDRARWASAWPTSFHYDESSPLGALTVNQSYLGLRLAGHSASDPELFAGEQLRTVLAQQGIVVDGDVVRGGAPADAEEVAVAPSPSVRDMVAFMDSTSDNFTAEVLLKDVAVAAGTRPGSTRAGALETLRQVGLIGLPTTHLRFLDGSGLAYGNRTTARDLASLLDAVDRDVDLRDPFESALAVSGRFGTLHRRLRGAPYGGRVHAKTGTLDVTSAMSGFADGVDGSRHGFAIVSYAHGGRVPVTRAHHLQDAIAAILVR